MVGKHVFTCFNTDLLILIKYLEKAPDTQVLKPVQPAIKMWKLGASLILKIFGYTSLWRLN